MNEEQNKVVTTEYTPRCRKNGCEKLATTRVYARSGNCCFHADYCEEHAEELEKMEEEQTNA
jgi:hypothetical protein